MMSIKSLAGLSVDDFFRNYNWHGKPPKLESVNQLQIATNDSNILSLSLGDFLQQVNWTGETVAQTVSQPIIHSRQTIMTLSVSDFFQGITWKSFPKTTPTSKLEASKKSINSGNKALDVNNLSNLF